MTAAPGTVLCALPAATGSHCLSYQVGSTRQAVCAGDRAGLQVNDPRSGRNQTGQPCLEAVKDENLVDVLLIGISREFLAAA